MTWLLISTSSPVATVALFEDNRLLDDRQEHAPMRASGAVMRMIDALSSDPELYVADIGPGSFTGVRVGVTIAKTLAYVRSAKVAGISSFDLINPSGAAAVSSRKGMFLVRDEFGIDELPEDHPRAQAAFRGLPSARSAAGLYSQLQPMQPFELLPEYILEPNISKPKMEFGK